MQKILRKITGYHLLIALAVLVVALFGHPTFAMAGMAGMIIDAQCLLSDAQSLSGAATTVSTNVFDTVLATNQILAGEPLAVQVTIDVAAASGSGGTFQFQLIQSANPDLSSPDVLSETNTSYLTQTLLVKGFKFALPFPPTGFKTKRYLGIQYVLGGTTPSITLTAEILPQSFIQNEVVYPKNYTITS